MACDIIYSYNNSLHIVINLINGYKVGTVNIDFSNDIYLGSVTSKTSLAVAGFEIER